MTEASDIRPLSRLREGATGRPEIRPEPKRRAEWLVPAGLIVLSLVPVVAGAMRLTELSGGGITPDNARFFATPVPVVLHIIGATVFCVLGAFQFVPSLRRRRWHRFAGRILAPSGLIAAISGLWLTVFFSLPAADGGLLLVLRLVFGTAMAASIVVAVVAIVRGDVRRHGAWMTRGYAIGLGAGTQVITLLVGTLLIGPPDAFAAAVLMGAGWLINLVVAELVIRRRVARSGSAFGTSGRSAAASAHLS